MTDILTERSKLAIERRDERLRLRAIYDADKAHAKAMAARYTHRYVYVMHDGSTSKVFISEVCCVGTASKDPRSRARYPNG